MISINVVAVDDSKLALGFMEDYLTEINKTIPLTYQTFTSPATALSYIKTKSIDIVISDVEMAEMSGLELVSRVKFHNPSIRCVLVTSLTHKNDFDAGKKAGADNYLLKPIDETHLRSLLRLTSLKKQK